MTSLASDAVHNSHSSEFASIDTLADRLNQFLVAQLSTVLQPQMLRLRTLVIGEVNRFPALARAVYENGPARAIAALAEVLDDARARGVLDLADPQNAATQLNWLVMGEPVNRAMFLGEGATPTADEIADHVAAAVGVFLASYGVRDSRDGIDTVPSRRLGP